MFDSLFREALRLNENGQAFALAIVVRHEKPSSGKIGDKAVIRADGTIEGWIGGGCVQPVVIREARKTLADGQPRFVRIAPSDHDSPDGIIEYPMTCHSGGTLDVYIEPVFPKPHIVIFGKSAVAQALTRLGKAIDYRITVIAPEADATQFAAADVLLNEINLDDVSLTDSTFLIVASQGHHDERALTTAVGSNSEYVALVASRKKAAALFDRLRQDGVAEAAIERVRVPAGLDIEAKLPEEIAVSILAEIIQVMRQTVNPNFDASSGKQSDRTDGHTAETLHIGEMSCAQCIDTVEKTLGGLDGVTVHDVDIGAAAVSYDRDVVPRSRIVEALEARGYPVTDAVTEG